MFQSQEYVGVLIAAARRSLRQAVQRSVEPLHLNPPQFWSLLAIDEMSGASLGELAKRMRVDAPAASRAVAALVRRGLVRFQLDRADRRRSRLSLTKPGEELVRKLRPIADDLRARVVSGMNPAEEESLRTLLRKVIRNLDGAARRSGR
ncbi:MAG TPA: MarR family transcriptional regulator [Myxococcales bacterium]|nr:MarR family transcriptional regulator [Myxococcales bacterium]